MGGSIQSRQVVSSALVSYVENRILQKEIKLLKEDVLNISTILMKEDLKKVKSTEDDKDLHDKDWSHHDPDDYPEGNYKGEF